MMCAINKRQILISHRRSRQTAFAKVTSDAVVVLNDDDDPVP